MMNSKADLESALRSVILKWTLQAIDQAALRGHDANSPAGILNDPALQVIAASALLAVLLVWGAQYFDWVEMRGKSWQRIGLLAALLVAAAVLYFGALWAAGLKLRQMLRR